MAGFPQDPWKSPLDQITTELERHGDEWRMSLNLEAEAENAFRRVHAIAWSHASADNIAITARSKHCENQPDVVEAKCAWNLTIARSRACASKVDELKSRLFATMNDQKFQAQVT